MKHIFTTLLLSIVCIVNVNAQKWNPISSNSPTKAQATLISSDNNKTTFEVELGGFYSFAVNTPRGEANVIALPGSPTTFDAGQPELPSYAVPVIIDDMSETDYRITTSDYQDFHNIDVAPFKGHFSRSVNPDDVPYTYGQEYERDEFFPQYQASISEPYIIRDFRGQNIIVYPFAYNPIEKTLRVYHKITIEVYKTSKPGQNQLRRRSNTIRLDSELNELYKKHFINYQSTITRYTPIDEEGDMLIICHEGFLSAMTPFVNWKRTIGRPTTIVSTNTTGTTDSAIKNYIQTQYNTNPNLTYILLVGDVAQIPGHYVSAGTYSGYSDNWYGQVVGNDYYNDIFVGRFSAENTTHVSTQVNKTIHYERDLDQTATWLSIAQGVSKNEGVGQGHYGEGDYQHIDNIKDDLLAYTYTQFHRDYQNVSGVTSSAAIISQHINSGVGNINYCNHGSETSWGVFNYSNSHVNALTNDNKLPFICSVACLNGKYDYSIPCFAETWMRATNNSTSAPTGAVATLMSYISQPWLPPMYGQDEITDILVESYANNIKRTYGGISINGIMTILDIYGTSNSSAIGTYNTWNLFGDPSLTVRTKTPEVMTINAPSTLNTSATSYTLTATNANGARATITKNNQILGTAIITNGTATINVTGLSAGDATLCVFGYNKKTYISTITISTGGTAQMSATASASPTLIPAGASSTLSVNVTGGTSPYTYSWSPAASLNNANIASPTASPTQTTTYTVSVSDGSNTATSNVIVQVVTAPSNVNTTIQNTNNIRVSWNSASLASSYKIYRNGTLVSTTTSTSYVDSNLSSGTYCYQVSSVYNNVESPRSNESCQTITAPLTATASATPNTIPQGSSSTLNVNVTGGSAPYNYSWSPASSLNNANIANPTATPSQTTTYTVTVSAGGSSTTATVTVNVVRAPSNLTTTIQNTNNIRLTWNAATPANSYKIYKNGTFLSNTSSTSYIDSNLSPGTYCYEVSTVYNNVESPRSNESCQTIYATLDATASATPTTIAEGSSSQLQANVSGGSGAYTYSWSPANSLNNASIANPVATPTQQTTYTVTVSDGNTSTTASVTIQVVKAPTNLIVAFEDNKMQLTWSNAILYQSYKIYRDGSLIASNVAGNSFIDEDLEVQYETEYCYTVSAVYNNIESPQSSQACATATFECTAPYALIGNYYWNNTEEYGVSLSWEVDVNNVNNEYLDFFIIYHGNTLDEMNKVAETTYNSGNENQSYIHNVQEPGSHYYRVTAHYNYSSGDCESSHAISNNNPNADYVVVDVTSLSDNNATIKIFPNPSHGDINIEAEGIEEISLINSFGQRVLTRQMEQDNHTIHLKDYCPGIYMIMVKTKDNTFCQRIIIE